MEELEMSTEAVEEQIHHLATHTRENWISQVALSSALFAVLAAIGALLSNHHANEAMIQQIKASDHWAYYQAKGIKSGILSMKMELLASLGKTAKNEEQQKISLYKQEQSDVYETAQKEEESSERHLKHHVILSRGVTLFQIAIAIAAISVLTRLRRFWFVSLGFASIGLAFLLQGIFLTI